MGRVQDLWWQPGQTGAPARVMAVQAAVKMQKLLSDEPYWQPHLVSVQASCKFKIKKNSGYMRTVRKVSWQEKEWERETL
jgi:hypothetical protein